MNLFETHYSGKQRKNFHITVDNKQEHILHLLLNQPKSLMTMVSQRETLNQLKLNHGLLK